MNSENSTASDRKRVSIITSALPPLVDGIGDYSSRLGSALSQWMDVSIHTVRGFAADRIAGVKVFQSFDIAPRRAVTEMVNAVQGEMPDWLILQYNPFCFGARGFNPYLAATIRRIKKSLPNLKVAVMLHERFMPGNSVRYALVWMYQCVQFWAITRLADITLFSTGPWAEAYRRWYPDRACLHMPVGSNLPCIQADRDAVRNELGFGPDALVLGSFGSNHPSRLFNLLAASARHLKSAGLDVQVLSIGSAGPDIKNLMPELPVVDLSHLPEDLVSKNLQAIDIYFSPFVDGVSTRRGSFFAGLQHGLPTVTTRGYNTDGDLLNHADNAFVATESGSEKDFVNAVLQLANDRSARKKMGEQAKICFDNFYSLPVLAGRWHDLIMDDGRPVRNSKWHDTNQPQMKTDEHR